MLHSAIGRLRAVGLLEGCSFLVLLYASIVRKRMQGHEEAILIPGWIHGFLFVLFCILLVIAKRSAGWPVKTAVKPFVASLLPFGPFVIEPWLRREDERVRKQVP